jgi:DNA replication protein DnaC
MTSIKDKLAQRDRELAAARAALKAELGSSAESLADAIARAQADEVRRQSDPAYNARRAREERELRFRLEAFKIATWRDKLVAVTHSTAVRFAFEYKLTPAVRTVLKWLDEGCPHDLVMRGGIGSGKTTGAMVAAARWTEPDVFVAPGGEIQERQASKVINVTWLRPDALVSAIKHAYDEHAPKLHKFLILDDLGCETRPDFNDCLCEVLDTEGITILATTNQTKEHMRSRYDPRIIDRLNERARFVDIPGNSMRGKKGGF